MKTVKFYNKTTGRWEPIAGITRLGGVDNYEDLANKPDLSIYATKDDLEAMKQEIIDLINSLPSQPQEEPISAYYTEYTIDNSVSTFSLRGTSTPISDSQYMPKFSNGYNYIKLTLTDGRVTTNVNTPASSVDKVRIYYPEETTYVKFTDTKVKDVEHIECSNFTDATDMFKGCSSLQSADLSTMNSSNVTVDASMFRGANAEAAIIFNDEWSYTNRDMGLIKMVTVMAHLYREDGMYEYSMIDFKSPYDEHYTSLLFSHEDPEDSRWRFEPLYIEAGVTYTGRLNDCGNICEEFTFCFNNDASIFFDSPLASTYTEYRPEIGGGDEPVQEYITGFSLGYSSISLQYVGMGQDLPILPNETGRPMNFVVDTPNSSWSVLSSYYNEGLGCITLNLMSTCVPFEGYVTIRETYSETTQQVYIFVQPKVTLTVHYKDVNGDISGDYLYIEGIGDFYFNSWGTTFSYELVAYTPYTLNIYAGYGQMHLGQINLSGGTEIWISEDSSEIMYENPDQPDTPSEVSITVHYKATDGSIENNEVDFYNPETGTSYWVRFDGNRTEVFTDNFGYYSTLNLPAYNAYKVATFGNLAEQSDWFEETLDATYDREIWIIDNQLRYYTYEPEIVIPQHLLTIYSNWRSNPVGDSFVLTSTSDESVTHTLKFWEDELNMDMEGVYYYVSRSIPEGNYYIDYYYGEEHISRFGDVLELRGNMEIWTDVDMGLFTTYNPNQPEVPDQPSGGTISGFVIQELIDKNEITLDNVDRRDFYLTIYPNELGMSTSWSMYFEDYNFSENDVLYGYFNSDDYNYNGGIAVNSGVYIQISGYLGTATMVIREDYSGIEQRIPISVVEPAPIISGFTVSPESITISEENPLAVINVVQNEMDRATNFTIGWSSMSVINWWTETAADGTLNIMVEADPRQMYKEEITLWIQDERSWYGASVSCIIDSNRELGNLKVHYHNPDNEYDYGESLIIRNLETGTDNGYNFHEADLYGRFINETVVKGDEYILLFEYQGETLIEDTSFTFNENFNELWIVKGDNTFYTSKPDSIQVELVTLTLHYNRKNGDYDDWDVWNWCNDGNHQVVNSPELFIDEEDDFGKIAHLQCLKDCTLGYIIRKGDWVDKNHDDDQSIYMDGDKEIWVTQGQSGYYDERPNLDEVYPDEPEEEYSNLILTVSYRNDDEDYSNCSLVTAIGNNTIHTGLDKQNSYGVYDEVEIRYREGIDEIVLKVYLFENGESIIDGDSKYVDCSQLNITEDENGNRCAKVYLLENDSTVYYENPIVDEPTEPDTGMVTFTLHYEKPYDNNRGSIDINGEELYFDENGVITKQYEPGTYIYMSYRGLGYDVGTLTEDKEVWMLSGDRTLYDHQVEVPSYEKYNVKVHLYKPDSDYSEGWHIDHAALDGWNGWTGSYDCVDDFGLVMDLYNICTNVPNRIQLLNDNGDYDPCTHYLNFPSPVTDVWLIWGDSTTYLEQPEI